MLVRELKLKLNKKQEQTLNDWLICLSSVYNFGIRKIELNANNKIYFSKFEFVNTLSNHGKKINISSHTIQGVLEQAYVAWDRCFKKLGKKPKLKSVHNKMRSIPFPDPINNPKNNTIRLPILGSLRFFKQELPIGKIKRGRIVKRSTGWYLQLAIDTVHTFNIEDTSQIVGIDTGFKSLAVLSDGTTIENKKYFTNSQTRLAQAQRGKNKKLCARLSEKITNKRKDYNHKVSKKIVKNYKEIYITNDNLRGQSKLFGKSVNDSGISQLRKFIVYKGDNHNRLVKLVDSKNTTKTCSFCWSITGPSGLEQLAVREWECSSCGEVHDRDINSAKVILALGLGANLVPNVMYGLNRNSQKGVFNAH